MKKYKAVYSINEILEVPIVSDTPHFISVKGWNGKVQREAKQSNYYTYHDTHEAAKADILSRLEQMMQTRRSQIKWLESEIEKAKKL